MIDEDAGPQTDEPLVEEQPFDPPPVVDKPWEKKRQPTSFVGEMKVWGAALRDLRAKTKLTQTEMSKLLKKKPYEYGNWERAAMCPRAKKARDKIILAVEKVVNEWIVEHNSKLGLETPPPEPEHVEPNPAAPARPKDDEQVGDKFRPLGTPVHGDRNSNAPTFSEQTIDGQRVRISMAAPSLIARRGAVPEEGGAAPGKRPPKQFVPSRPVAIPAVRVNLAKSTTGHQTKADLISKPKQFTPRQPAPKVVAPPVQPPKPQGALAPKDTCWQPRNPWQPVRTSNPFKINKLSQPHSPSAGCRFA